MPIVTPIVQEPFIPENYISSPEIIKNCLQEVPSEDMMYSQVSAPADNENMTKKQRENIIKKHMEQYTTKYYESDRRWHSFLPDETHPRKMKPIVKRKLEDLETVILAYYERSGADQQTQEDYLADTVPGVVFLQMAGYQQFRLHEPY